MSDLRVLILDANTGRYTLGMPTPPEEISGIDLLVQNVTLLFLSNGGRSIVIPDRVGGLRRFLGGNFNPDDPTELFADITMMTRQIEQQIKEEQVSTNRQPSERLQSLQLIDIIPFEEEGAIEIRVAVVNEEQQQQQALVVV